MSFNNKVHAFIHWLNDVIYYLTNGKVVIVFITRFENSL